MISVFSLVFVLAPSFAGIAGVADTPAARLKELERQAAESRARAAELAGRTARIESELTQHRRLLTDAAAQVRAGEEASSRLETEQTALSEKLARESAVLDQDRTELAQLPAGLVRLARLPPGALLARPDSPIEAARAAMLVQAALTATREGARKAELELAQMDDVSRQLAAKQSEVERQAVALTARQADLAALMQKRQALYEQTESDRQAEEERSRKIAEEAKDLRDLVARIEAEQAEEARREAAREAEARRKASLRREPPPKPDQGHFTASGAMPVAGSVKIRFGQNDGLGTTAHGLTIATRPGATVTAPAAGRVKFAGPFRGYHEILILEHSGGYLSLIAGMKRVDAPLGATVGAGEPIGVMDDRQDSKPELYYELRHNGQFVDPEAIPLPADVKGKVR